jgi:hypothetical protein
MARAVTSQVSFRFDIRINCASWDENTDCWIHGIRPLPEGVHQTLLGLDRKYQDDRKSGLNRPYSDFKLTADEKQALLFTRPFYAENLGVAWPCRVSEEGL